MFKFLKKKNKYKEVPEWAGMFNLNDFNRFIDCIEQYFYSKQINFNMDKGIIEVPEIFGNGNQLGLPNLAGICRQLNNKEWKAAIREHFHNLEKRKCL